LIQDYYIRHPTGGKLHVVLDDLNIDDGDIEAALEYANLCAEEECPTWCDLEAALIGWMLIDVDSTLREQLIKEATDGKGT
jgi:hypothetical protein